MHKPHSVPTYVGRFRQRGITKPTFDPLVGRDFDTEALSTRLIRLFGLDGKRLLNQLTI